MQQQWPDANVVITQYNMKRELQKFGDRGAVAVEKEVIQLFTMDEI